MTKIEELNSKSGELIYKVDNYYLHSKYNPIKEAEQIASQNYIPHLGYILFGYGAGYLVDALLKTFKHNEILLVVDPLIHKSGLEIQKRHNNLCILGKSFEDELYDYIFALTDHFRWSLNVICSQNYDKLFPEEYLKVLQTVKSLQNQIIINDATTVRYQKDWHVNIVNNLLNIPRDTNLVELKGKYNDPVIVISGGPSLVKHIELLKEIKSKSILIAAGSTINTLLKEGIEPHYVVSIDGGEPNYNHFKNINLKESQIIYTMQNHYKVRDSFEKFGYYVGSTGYELVTEYLEQKTNQRIPVLNGGGSVAHIAFSIAQYISTGPIAIIGQDLAFTDNLTHAPNNIHSKLIDEEFIKRKEAYQVNEYNGGMVWTTSVFDSMRIEFQDMVKVNPPKVPFYNCTEGGVLIEGFNNLKFKAFCEEYIDKEIIIYTPKQQILISFDTVENIISDEITTYGRIIKLLGEAIITLKLNRSNRFFEKKILKKLEELDSKIDIEMKKVLLDILTGPLKLELMKCFLEQESETEEQTYNRVLNQNITLYIKLKEAAEFAKNCDEKALERLRGNNSE